MKIILKSLPPSTNQLERLHWAAKKRMRNALRWELIEAMATGGAPMPPVLIHPHPGRMRVRIKVYRPRLLDPDNAMGGLKVLLDAMRDMGLLKNDSPKWLDLAPPEQIIERKNCRTEIIIEDIPTSTLSAKAEN
jgi:hypothetical protein